MPLLETEHASSVAPANATDEATGLCQNNDGGLFCEPSDFNQTEGQDAISTSSLSRSDNALQLLEAEKQTAPMSGFCQATKIQPLDLPIEIQPSDPIHMGKSDGPPDIKRWNGPGNLGFEFFSGPNSSSGLHNLKANETDYYPFGLQDSGPLPGSITEQASCFD